MKRHPKYMISFGYKTGEDEKTIFGVLKPKTVEFETLDYIIKILDPLRSGTRLGNISNLPKRGVVMYDMESIEDNGLKVMKVLKIERV